MNEETFGNTNSINVQRACWFNNGTYSAVFQDSSSIILFGDKFTYYNADGKSTQLLTKHPLNTDDIKPKLMKALEVLTIT